MLALRDRLLLAFANAASYGIAARPALRLSPERARAALAAELQVRHPSGTGSFVYWTERDDEAFELDGTRNAELELHCSDPATARAVDAACRQAGVSTRPDGHRTTLTVERSPANAGSRA